MHQTAQKHRTDKTVPAKTEPQANVRTFKDQKKFLNCHLQESVFKETFSVWKIEAAFPHDISSTGS